MSNSVDNRIVEMQFDNKLFEKNVQTSVKSLEMLKKSLDFEKTTKSIGALDSVFKSFSLHKINAGIQDLNKHFSLFEVMSRRIVENITDSVVTATRQIANLMTQSVRSGFAEYETQINAVQTILANTSDAMNKAGYSEQQRLDIVNEKLDELNRYADKTIYNFTEMTNNIGRFTAAGVELDTAVTSIQGIANLAAVSGSTSQQASTAMYQLSQALSAGTLKLMDWNSVVNAGMGGEIFQKALMRTAKTMGVTGEEATKMFAQLESGELSFRDSLSSGWITSEVLTATLSQFAMDFEEIARAQGITVEAAKEIKKAELISQGYTSAQADEIINLAQTATDAATKVKTLTQLFDTLKEAMQSGWTQTWEYIIGDFGEAKELFTGISDYFGNMINQSSESRNAIVKQWKDLGGRDAMIEGLWNIIKAIENISSKISDVISKIFPPMTGERLYSITTSFRDLTKRFLDFTESTEHAQDFSTIIEGMASAFDLLKKAADFVGKAFVSLLGGSNASSNVLKFFAGLSECFTKFKNYIDDSDMLGKSLATIGVIGERIRLKLKTLFSIFNDGLNTVREYVVENKIFDKLYNLLVKIGSVVPSIVSKIRNGITSIFDFFKSNQLFTNSTLSFNLSSILDSIQDGASKMSGVFLSWKDRIASVWNDFSGFISDVFLNRIPTLFKTIGNAITPVFDRLASIDWMHYINKFVGIYSLITTLSIVKDITSGIRNIGSGIKSLGKGLKEGLSSFSKSDADTIGTTLLKMAGSIMLIIAAMYIVSKIDNDAILKGLGIISIIAAELIAISLLVGKSKVNGTSLLGLSAALLLMIVPIKMLSAMPIEQAFKGIAMLGIILAELGIFLKMAGRGFTGKTPFIGLAIGINLLVFAMKSLGDIKVEQLAKSLVGIGLLLFELALFMRSVKDVGKIKGLISIAITLNLMCLAMRGIGKMKTRALIKSVAGIGTVLMIFSGFMKTMKGVSSKSALITLLSIAGTMAVFILAFKQVENTDMSKLTQFAASFSAFMLAFSASMWIMSKVSLTGAIVGSLGAVAGAAILIAGIAGILAALDLVQRKFPDFQATMERGGDVLSSISRAIGKFFSGFATGLTDGLPDIGTNLSKFMTNLQPFLDGCAGITDEMYNGAKRFASFMIDIAWAEVMLGLATLFGVDPITKYSTDILKLGLSLKAFSFIMKGFNGTVKSDVNNAIDAGNALARLMTEVPWDMPTWLKAIVGFRDTETFKMDMGNLAEALTTFSEKVNGFATGKTVSQADTDAAIAAVNGLAALLEGMKPNKGAWPEFIGFPSLGTFGTDLPEFATNLKTFAENISGFTKAVTEEDIKNSTSAARGLIDLLNALPNTEGGWPLFIGFPSLENFGSQLPQFAADLKTYATNIKGFTTAVSQEDLNNSNNAARGLIDLLNMLPNTGGWWQRVTGVPDLKEFSTILPGFAASMLVYAKEINHWDETVDESNVENSTKAAQGLVALAKALPAEGGWWQSITGTKDLGNFAGDIASLGEALNSFAASITTVKVDDVTTMDNVVTAIDTFVKGFFGHDNLWDQFVSIFSTDGKIDDLIDYTAKMKLIGDNMSAFTDGAMKVGGDEDVFTPLQTTFDKMREFAQAFREYSSDSDVDIMKQVIKTSTKFSEFSGEMGTFFDNINKFGSSDTNFEKTKALINGFRDFLMETRSWITTENWVEGEDWLNVTTLLGVLESYGSSIYHFSANLNSARLSDLEIAADALATFVTTLSDVHDLKSFDTSGLQDILNGMSHLIIPKFDTEGAAAANTFIQNLNEGIQNGIKLIETAARDVAVAGANAASETFGLWSQTGVNLIEGLRGGILSRADSIRNAASAVARGAVLATRNVWMVRSPSRVGETLGMYYDLGLAGGIRKYGDSVSAEASAVGRNVIETSKNMLGGFSNGLLDYIDPTPTIRPVMDISNIQSGVNNMNALFARNPVMHSGFFSGMTFASGVNALGLEDGKIPGVRDNRDIVEELQMLSEQFDELSYAVSNMQVILDTGILVGETSAKMDNQLGTIAMRRNRGN